MRSSVSHPTRTSVAFLHGLALFSAALLLGACSLVIANDPGAGPAADGGLGARDAAAGLDAGAPVDGMVFVPDAGPLERDGGPTPCAAGAVRCEGATLVTCRDGMETHAVCALGCGDGRCRAFVPSNVGADLWDSAAASVDLEDGRSAFDTTMCRAMAASSRVVPQSSGAGPDVCVLQVRDLRIREGAGLVVVGSRPLVIMASGRVTIEGTLDVSADLGRSGAGGFRGGTPDEIDGSGPTAGGGGEHVDLFADGGGGGGGLCGAGGAGGAGGTASGGTQGPALDPSWELVPLVGGSGGGRGRGTFAAAATNAGLGGAGGGAIQISARERIQIDGRVAAGGGGGGAGTNTIAAGNYGSGGGGGSGGAILLEAPEVEVRGTLGAAGGGGGGGADVRDGAGEDGDNGVVGGLGRASGGAPGGAFAGRGGDGGGGTVHDGDAAGDGRGSSGNGGGGGGGAGCILVRTETGEASVANANPTSAPGFRVKRVHAD